MTDADAVDRFILSWSATGGSELANTQSFINELCALIGVEPPRGSRVDDAENSYVFERRVFEDNGDGTSSFGRVDCYKKGSFVLEAKQGTESDRTAAGKGDADLDLFGQTAAVRVKRGTAKRGTPGWTKAMTQAKRQAERYAKALPIDHGWPPFLLVADVGYCIEVYADFSGTGKAYAQFPDRTRSRIMLDDLRDAKVRERLTAIWDDPTSLDPAAETTRVTREIGDLIATLARRLEKRGYSPTQTSGFLMRTLFTMFAEDIGLLPKDSFTVLLKRQKERPELLHHQLQSLWEKMDTGGFVGALGPAGETVRRFNGYLFKDTEALKLDSDELDVLITAAGYDWTQVEPAIFGTLLERALDPKERAKLGAHYTPRASVERLVMPTIIEPLRADWVGVQTAAVELIDQTKRDAARKVVETFHAKLAQTKVLDPACGTGNFLYVAMARMKELEGEVISMLIELDDRQYVLEISGHTITTENFLGIEINPRAAAIAQLVLWIGYLQWHFRMFGAGQSPPDPVLTDVRTIQTHDALIDWDKRIPLEEAGKPVRIWDGTTMKKHPVTGQLVPDESALMDVFRYVNPRATSWPKADFIVGNPPFIGNKLMRRRLGAPYTEAVRGAYPDVPREVDFVMYWWDRAARLVGSGKVRRAGLITTKTIAQSNARPVLRTHMQSRQNPVSLVFAIANYPWHDTETTAAVRIAMTTIAKGRLPGSLVTLVNERRVGRETIFDVVSETGFIQVDLSLGAEVASVTPLKANAGLSWMGVKMSGEAFRIDRVRRAEFVARGFPEERLPLVVAGSDITDPPSEFYAVDCYDLREDVLKSRYPSVYQYLSDYVRPARDQNDRDSYKDNWWQFAEPRPKLRASIAGLRQFIGTSETSKHRIFRFVDRETSLIDGSVIAIASDDAYVLGVLASRFHRLWSDRAGGRMGAGNDPRYQNEMCFDPFPFPAVSDEALKDSIRAEAEALDVLHRDIVMARLTITDVYNVLDALNEVKSGTRSLTDAERDTYERGLVSVVAQRLAEIDRLVALAYGWNGDLSNEEVLTRLVALNRTRAAEETEGLVRYLRPEIQIPAPIAPKLPLTVVDAQPAAQLFVWPGTLPEQIIAVAGVLSASPSPLMPADVAHAFKGKRDTTIVPILDALAAMGQARKLPNGRYAA
jgi:hypothetical protein